MLRRPPELSSKPRRRRAKQSPRGTTNTGISPRRLFGDIREHHGHRIRIYESPCIHEIVRHGNILDDDCFWGGVGHCFVADG